LGIKCVLASEFLTDKI